MLEMTPSTLLAIWTALSLFSLLASAAIAWSWCCQAARP